MSETWYYARDRPIGPISLDELKRRLSKMKDWRKKLVWNAGFSEWREAETVPELEIVGPPPIPKRAAKAATDLVQSVRAWAAFLGMAYIVFKVAIRSGPRNTVIEHIETFVDLVGAVAILLGLIALGDWVWRHTNFANFCAANLLVAPATSQYSPRSAARLKS